MRRAALVFAVAAPVTLLVVTVAAANDGPRVGPPSPVAQVAPLAVQPSDTKKDLLTTDGTSRRDTRLRADRCVGLVGVRLLARASRRPFDTLAT